MLWALNRVSSILRLNFLKDFRLLGNLNRVVVSKMTVRFKANACHIKNLYFFLGLSSNAICVYYYCQAARKVDRDRVLDEWQTPHSGQYTVFWTNDCQRAACWPWRYKVLSNLNNVIVASCCLPSWETCVFKIPAGKIVSWNAMAIWRSLWKLRA